MSNSSTVKQLGYPARVLFNVAQSGRTLVTASNSLPHGINVKQNKARGTRAFVLLAFLHGKSLELFLVIAL